MLGRLQRGLEQMYRIETRLEVEFINSVWEVLPNDTLGALLDKNLRHSGGVKYTPEEQAFAETLYKTLESPRDPLGTQETIRPMSEARELGGSTDVGDISWLVPTAQFSAEHTVRYPKDIQLQENK